MNFNLRPLLAVAPLLVASVGAQTTAEPTPTPTPAKRTSVEVSGPTERISRSTSSALAAGITYQPPKPVEKKPEPTEEELEAEREKDKPANGIVRLPKYVVEGYRPPVFREKDIHTDKGMGDLAVKKYLSETGKALNAFTIPIFGMSKEAYAKMLYAEDERLKNMEDANQNVYILRKANPAAAGKFKDEVDATFIRSDGFTPTIGNTK